MWTAPSLFVLKGGSCAIRGCEPCQVGDQAALSGLSGVPRGCLLGANGAVNACKRISKDRCMVLSDASSNTDFQALRNNAVMPQCFFVLNTDRRVKWQIIRHCTENGARPTLTTYAGRTE